MPWREFKVEIPKLPELQSAGQTAKHWHIRWRDKKWWKSQIAWHARSQEFGAFPPIDPARVKLTRRSTQEPDPDNLVSSFKDILDALVKAGVLAGDKPENFEGGKPDYAWEKAKRGEGGVVIWVGGYE